jgi:AraC-like DNA-binding protein
MRWKIRCTDPIPGAQHIENKRGKRPGSFPSLSARPKRCPRQPRGISDARENSLSMEQYEKLYLYKRIVLAKLFIDRNFADNIDVDKIANQANFSKFHFIRLFKAICGKSPHNYLIGVRVEKAKKFLGDGISILDVSQQVGFESPTSFSATFKKMAGKTPSEYRNQLAVKRSAIHTNPLSAIPNCFAETHGWKR